MKPNEVPKIMRDALAVHEGFRRLGFSSDDLYLIYANKIIYIYLRRSDTTFSWKVGPTEMSYEALKEIWHDAVHHWNAIWTQEDNMQIWREGPLANMQASLNFIGSLVEAGVWSPFVKKDV